MTTTYNCGHPRAPENTYTAKAHGKRYPTCDTCKKARARKAYLARKKRLAAPQGGRYYRPP